MAPRRTGSAEGVDLGVTRGVGQGFAGVPRACPLGIATDDDSTDRYFSAQRSLVGEQQRSPHPECVAF